MLPHISKTCDTTQEASFHASLNHAVNTCSVHGSHHKKHNIRYFAITTIVASHKLTDNSYTKLPQYQQYTVNKFWKNLRLLSLTHNHSHETAGELWSIINFTLQTLHYTAK